MLMVLNFIVLFQIPWLLQNFFFVFKLATEFYKYPNVKLCILVGVILMITHFFMNNLLFVMRVEDLAGVLADTELKCYQHTVFAEA